ncbi:MAG TPA: thioredoxin domain-containing protein, partial [Verrucomicrobiae bacterium]|nr:thioredoxin domain-containing protein [Verrucomicrobiae bacterium]
MHSRQMMKQVLVPLALAVLTIAAPALASAQQPSAGGFKFPAPSPQNFTAVSPSRATVEAFLKVAWGYDANRMWQVWAIEKTPAPGVSRVIVEVAQKNDPQHQIESATFLVTPDGKHLVSTNLEMLPFGAHPYAEARETLMQRANGPSRGAASKVDEIVEFADFQCPHCKASEPIIQRLLTDFPQAHFVFENFPLTSIHTEAFKAAAYSECVAQ